MKTATSDVLIETTVKPICLAPLSAAPSCFAVLDKRKTFSITTIASSTTKPTEIVIAISDKIIDAVIHST